MTTAVLLHQLRVLQRQGVVAAVVGTFVAVTALAGVLGWSSHQTIARVFDEAVRLLAATGAPPPPNPFLAKPTLSALSNLVVYVPLVGALLALVLGHVCLADDKSSGLGRLVFTRSIGATQFATGRVMAMATVLALMVLAGWLVSAISLIGVNGSLAAGDVGRLSLFTVLSWVYLLGFGLLGMLTVLVTRTRALGLLVAIGAWLVLTFAVPQLTSGLQPTQSLNPVAEAVGTSQRFFEITSHARPVSIVEQYKAASGVVLRVAAAEPLGTTALRVVPLVALDLLCLAAVLRLVGAHDWSRSATDA